MTWNGSRYTPDRNSPEWRERMERERKALEAQEQREAEIEADVRRRMRELDVNRGIWQDRPT